MWAIPTGASWLVKKKKIQVKSCSIWSRVPETGSDPLIGTDRESGRDNDTGFYNMEKFIETEKMLKK